MKQLPESTPEQLHHHIAPRYEQRRFSFKKILLIAIACIILVTLYILGIKIVYARVHITERRIPFSVETMHIDLVHQKDTNATELGFQAMIVPSEVTREVYGSELTSSTTKATGKIIFLNEYSKSSQTVKAKTIVTSKEGKKYQTNAAITVPGYTLNGKVKKAGSSAPVGITAIEVGPAYNTTGTSFTVTGWSGTNAKLFYAQSAGAISGGENGVVHVIAEADKKGITDSLQAQLVEKLKRETRAQIPPSFISFPDLQFITVDTTSLNLKGQNIKFPASVKGTMVSYLINRDVLERAIAKEVIHGQSYTDVVIPDMADITVTPITAVPLDPQTIPDSKIGRASCRERV